ncbi:MAG: CsgG/HfaB family protein [Elusimicrobiales bacterium]|nr:CsgG/HfaB family protein [Elusimicrobiales bacterium]
MKRFSIALLSVWILTVLISPLRASVLDSKLEKTALKLTEAAEGRNITSATLAVFPFQADEKLSKKKVNFAVSEILTKDLLKLGKFTIIERAQIEEVMKEQKLGLSGAVDSETAAQIGKLAGAKLLVLGNVIQMGNSYQLTSKLISAETGEMIASEITEVPVKTFDEDAERYLVLVPESGALSLYLSVKYARLSGKSLGAQTAFGTTATDAANIGTKNMTPVGLGVRYWFNKKWAADAALYPNSYTFDTDILIQGASLSDPPKMTAKARDIRFLMNRVLSSSDKLRLLAGAGICWMEVSHSYSGSSGTLERGRGKFYASEVFYGVLRAGLQWRPSPRIGLELFGNLNAGDTEFETGLRFKNSTTQETSDIAMKKVSVPAFSPELSLSINF